MEPITEEWLKEIGFEEQGSGVRKYFGKSVHEDGDMNLCVFESSGSWEAEVYDWCHDCISLFPKYRQHVLALIEMMKP